MIFPKAKTPAAMLGFLISSHTLAYLTLVLIVGLSFWPGLSGSFFYDDFPHIVNNPAVLSDTLNFESLYQAAFSSHAGPTGRPVSMASFAVEYASTGNSSPFHYKLVNLLLHVANALLAAWLVSLLLQATGKDAQPSATGISWLPWWVAAFWALHPLTASAVLYIVQRMTLLAALFSLLALISYCSGRLAMARNDGGWIRVLLLPALLIAAGIYSKETAVVTIPIIIVIELVLFKFRMSGNVVSKAFQRAYWILMALGVTFVLWRLYQVFPHFLAGYQTRDFTLAERLYTESRVIWKYIAQCLLPDYRAMALFHDDFPISTGLLTPITTLISLAGLVAIIGIAFAYRKQAPLVTIGIAWFLIAHVPESTIIPLEIMHEHRNYFPMLGLILALFAALRSQTWLRKSLHPRTPIILGTVFLAATAFSTFLRSHELGDSQGYFIYEALRHPDSARSNTEAAIRLVDIMAASPQQAPRISSQAQMFIDRAIAANPNEIHAAFVGVMSQPFISQESFTNYFSTLKERLRTSVPHRSTSSLFLALNQALLAGKISMDSTQVSRLYESSLENPKLSGKTEFDILVAYASYKAWGQSDIDEAVRLIDSAASKSGNEIGVDLVRATIYLAASKLNEAKSLIATIEEKDTQKYYAKELRVLKIRLTDLTQSSKLPFWK